MLRKIAFIFLLVLILVSHQKLVSGYTPFYPRFQELNLRQSGFQDISLLVSGFRRVTADIAWIQLLQYMGGAEIFDLKYSGQYVHLKDLTMRVIHIDPYFINAYVFGGAGLAWLKVTSRPDEAIEIFKEGIRFNPHLWIFQAYVISIAYQKEDQIDRMLEALGKTVQQPDCPIQVKAILANTFKVNNRYGEALMIWEQVLISSTEESYRRRAQQQINEITKLMARSPAPPFK